MFCPFYFEESLLLLNATMPYRLVNNKKRFFISGSCVEWPITFHKTICIVSCLLFLIEQMSSEDMVKS